MRPVVEGGVSGKRDRLAGARLYGIADLGYLEESALEQSVAALLEGGVDLLQLRAKNHRESEIRSFAERVLPLCRSAKVPLIINDFSSLAREVGADGVHLGQDDGALAPAREELGPAALVGRSTHSVLQARAALEEGADYIGFGPLFPTPTKEGRPGIGLQDIARVECEIGAHIPVFCIGGIKMENLAQVLEAGARRVVIVSGLLQAEDIAARCRAVREILEKTEDPRGQSQD